MHISFGEKIKNGEITWEAIPQSEWINFLNNLIQLAITNVGFENIQSKSELGENFTNHETLIEKQIGCYEPFHKNSKSMIMMFELTKALNSHMKMSLLNEFGISENEILFDEIIFFVGSKAKYIWIPYMDLIVLQNYTRDDRLLLEKYCPNLFKNIKNENS